MVTLALDHALISGPQALNHPRSGSRQGEAQRGAPRGRHPQGSTLVGTELDAANVRRSFRAVVKAAGLNAEDWTPRELRHSFVSIMSDAGVPLERISRLVGHGDTTTTETVYRHQRATARARMPSYAVGYSTTKGPVSRAFPSVL